MKKKNNYNIFIKGLVLKAYIGIYSDEKINKQRIRFNVFISAKDNIKKENNDISQFVSYEDVINKIKKVLSLGHIPLLETMADKIADECLKNKKISLIKIRIEKLDIFKDAESVGIKIIRKQKK
ncbi:MAG: hypothetical protein CFH24_00204 [Alphaproteobacteria bacterium MarineAlpha6_Bin2]|nr:MAG: hypothetical protein CFH24_00204 [Alphaproteobacteria bacterium MarineAlpha6_Bin2]